MDSPEAVHLRDGPMMHLVVPTIRKLGGVNCVYVVRRLNDQVRGADVFPTSTSVSRDRMLD